jgi:HEAT repeat protein
VRALWAQLALLTLLGVCLAADPEEVRTLVRRLRSELGTERYAAYTRLARMGESAVPLLEEIRSDDPEVLRLLRRLRRSALQLRIEVLAPERSHGLGESVQLDVQIRNETDDVYALPLVRTPERRPGTLSALHRVLEGGERIDLRPEEVRVDARVDQKNRAVVRPREILQFEVSLGKEETPLSRPGRFVLAVGYELRVRRWPAHASDPRRAPWDRVLLQLRSDPVTIRMHGTEPRLLEEWLRGNDPRKRAEALDELVMRDDPAILRVLRRNAQDRDLRRTAIKRLGAMALDEDFRLVFDSTRSPDPQVRREAVLALGNFRRRKARSRLLALADDHELQSVAIQALRNFRNVATVEKLIAIMPRAEGAVVKQIQRILMEWTGIWVDDRLAEIDRFNDWWRKNRERWARENRSSPR